MPDIAASAAPSRPAQPPVSRASLNPTPDVADVADLLNGVVQNLPIGVALVDAAGSSVLSNHLASWLNEEDGGRTLDTASQTVAVRDAVYTLTTAIDVSHHQRLADDLFQKAYFDELTGLPNRALIEQSIVDLIATIPRGQHFALAFIDLDNFKYINDFYSHAAGDALLVKVSGRLTAALRDTDVLARIGGDEFVLLLSPVGSLDGLRADVDLLAERLKQPFFIDGHEIFASASIGVSVFPEHGTTYETLRRNADSAMYRVKSGVKGGSLLYDETMSRAATARMAVEQRFRLAVRDRRFCCAYQPKVDIRTQAVSGLEVLLRWRDEGGAIQPPGEFVALAIELGLIDEITFLVLAETVSALADIDDIFGPETTISLNVAAKQADDPVFMRSFCDALEATGCAPRFMVEITEEAFFAKSRFQTLVLPRLRAIGTKVSIDDFGVGYSSLAALADITADEIKIDRSFITDIHRRPRSQSILRAIESLGQTLGMSIVAEGVETFEELVWLQATTGIHHAQGYYFSKPMFLAELRERTVDETNRALAPGRAAAPGRMRDERPVRATRRGA